MSEAGGQGPQSSGQGTLPRGRKENRWGWVGQLAEWRTCDGRVPGVNASCPLPGPGALGKAPDPLCLGPPVSPMGPWDPHGSIVRHVKHLK